MVLRASADRRLTVRWRSGDAPRARRPGPASGAWSGLTTLESLCQLPASPDHALVPVIQRQAQVQAASPPDVVHVLLGVHDAGTGGPGQVVTPFRAECPAISVDRAARLAPPPGPGRGFPVTPQVRGKMTGIWTPARL